MENNTNAEILRQLFQNYIILQLVVFGINLLIWKKWIKSNKKIWTFVTLLITVIYLSYSIKLIIEILRVEDLKVGGYTFAFEMMSLIIGVVYFGLIVLTSIIAFFSSRR